MSKVAFIRVEDEIKAGNNGCTDHLKGLSKAWYGQTYTRVLGEGNRRDIGPTQEEREPEALRL